MQINRILGLCDGSLWGRNLHFERKTFLFSSQNACDRRQVMGNGSGALRGRRTLASEKWAGRLICESAFVVHWRMRTGKGAGESVRRVYGGANRR